tara:strand:+ start:108 stop:938 length:831 start_codon:yes stop_codon:yes gene_type:complete
MNKYFQLIRIQNLAIAIIAVLIANYMIKETNFELLVLSIICVCLTMAFGNVLNDVLDLESDYISHPQRPIPLNNITVIKAKKIAIILLLIIFIVSFFLNIYALMFLIFIIIPMLIGYNFFLKGIPLVGNITVSLLLSFVFIFTEIVFLQEIQITIIPSLLVFGLSFIREFIKDIHDYDGDKRYGVNTLPVIIGQSRSLYLSVVFICIFSVFAFIPYFSKYYNIKYFISLIILVEIPLFLLVSLLIKNPDKLMLIKIISWLKMINIAGLLVILISNN